MLNDQENPQSTSNREEHENTYYIIGRNFIGHAARRALWRQRSMLHRGWRQERETFDFLVDGFETAARMCTNCFLRTGITFVEHWRWPISVCGSGSSQRCAISEARRITRLRRIRSLEKPCIIVF